MNRLKRFLYKLLVNNNVAAQILNRNFNNKYSSSTIYWENRYLNNGTSGVGSYGDIAIYKAGILNKFVAVHNIKSVTELGCGDGNQLKQFEFPSYVGYDVSKTAIEKCKHLFKDDYTKKFFLYNPESFIKNAQNNKAELVLSLDVIYHLLEDDVYENYMQQLFSASPRYVIIYAWDVSEKQNVHVRHRKFSEWVYENKNDWKLLKKVESNLDGACDFFIFGKDDEAKVDKLLFLQ